jgi:ABC-2 type transport system permease protein
MLDMKGIILRIIKQMGNDKRTLALILAAPVIIMCLMYLLLGKNDYQPFIGVEDSIPKALTAALEKQDVRILTLASGGDTDLLLKNKDADAVLSMEGAALKLQMLEADSVKTAKITTALKEAMTSLLPLGKLQISFVYGGVDTTAFNSMGYVLLGVLSFFFVFIISGITFVRERESGTLERLMTTPVHRWQVVGGYTVGFGLFAAAQGIVITLFIKYVLGIAFEGSVLLAILLMSLLSFSAVSAGALVSIFANNEFQVMQFIPIVVIPQIFFSGLLSIETLPYGLGNLAYLMPVYYGCAGLKSVMVMGMGIKETAGYLLMLLGIIGILSMLNIFALKRYRSL